MNYRKFKSLVTLKGLITNMGTRGHDRNEQTTETEGTADRRRFRRLTDEEFNAYYNAWIEWLSKKLGAAVLHGLGWLFVAWALATFISYASQSKVSLGTVLKMIFE